MNIPKRAIELSIKGGWNTELEHIQWWFDDFGRMWCDNGNGIAASFGHLTYQSIALDANFWRCLGEELGWGSYYDDEGSPRYYGFAWYPDTAKKASGEDDKAWQWQAMRFCELIITGGDTDTYWQELLGEE